MRKHGLFDLREGPVDDAPARRIKTDVRRAAPAAAAPAAAAEPGPEAVTPRCSQGADVAGAALRDAGDADADDGLPGAAARSGAAERLLRVSGLDQQAQGHQNPEADGRNHPAARSHQAVRACAAARIHPAPAECGSDISASGCGSSASGFISYSSADARSGAAKHAKAADVSAAHAHSGGSRSPHPAQVNTRAAKQKTPEGDKTSGTKF